MVLRRHLTRRTAWILLALGLVALVLDWLFFTGFYASDDIGYLDTARSIANDWFLAPGTGAKLGNTRLGVTLPSGFVWKLTGSIDAVVWMHVLYHLALVPIAYALGRMLHDERAGLFAAALVAISPLLYAYAGAVLPDNASTCWLGLAMIALAAARHTDPGTRLTSWDRRRFTRYVVAGAMVGFCYWCKETALILTIPAAVTIIAAGPSVRSLVWVQNGASFTLGLVLVLLLEVLLLRTLTGDWINKLTYLQDSAAELRTTMLDQGTTPFTRLGFAADQVRKWMPVSTWLLLGGAGVYSFTRVRHLGLMIFFWFPVLYLTMGSTSFSEYLPPPIQARYFAIAILPAAVMTAIVASLALDRWPAKWTKPAVIAVLVLVGGFECMRGLPSSGTIYKATEARAFLAALDRADELHSDLPIVLSPYYSHRMLPLTFGRERVLLDPAHPKPPFIYLRKASGPEDPIRDPVISRAERLDTISAVRSHWTSIKQAVRRTFGAEIPKPTNERWAAELLIVR